MCQHIWYELSHICWNFSIIAFTIEVLTPKPQFIHVHTYVFPHAHITGCGGTSTLSLKSGNGVHLSVISEISWLFPGFLEEKPQTPAQAPPTTWLPLWPLHPGWVTDSDLESPGILLEKRAALLGTNSQLWSHALFFLCTQNSGVWCKQKTSGKKSVWPSSALARELN